jgi:hypothetical protein
MSDRQSLGDRILTLEDMDIGSADRRRRNPDQGVERTYFRNRLSSSAIRPGSTNIAARILEAMLKAPLKASATLAHDHNE